MYIQNGYKKYTRKYLFGPAVGHPFIKHMNDVLRSLSTTDSIHFTLHFTVELFKL